MKQTVIGRLIEENEKYYITEYGHERITWNKKYYRLPLRLDGVSNV